MDEAGVGGGPATPDEIAAMTAAIVDPNVTTPPLARAFALQTKGMNGNFDLESCRDSLAKNPADGYRWFLRLVRHAAGTTETRPSEHRSAVVELECEPEFKYPTLSEPDRAVRVEWRGKIAVDLRWVAAARPVGGEVSATSVSLCGSGRFDSTLNIPYSEFMALWMKAKGIA